MNAWSCLLLLVLPACAASRPTEDDAPGSGGTSGSGGAAGMSAGAHDPSTLEGFFGALCASDGPCCVDQGARADPKACLDFFQAIGAGITYDAVNGADCVKWLRAATHDYTVCLGTEPPPASCDKAFGAAAPVGGTHLPGEACSSLSECAPSAEGEVDCHFQSAETTTRICQLQLRGHAGDAPCLGTRDEMGTSGAVPEGGAPARGYVCDLADGVFCNGTACAPLSPLGGACNELQWCDLSTYCDNGTGTCVARQPVAAPCDWDGACLTGAYCDDATDSCAMRLAAGASCTDSAECASYLCSNGACYDNDARAPSLFCIPN